MSEKAWNAITGQWEINGVPITYRVTWKDYDDAGRETHEREFDDVDQGYSFYEDMRRSADVFAVTWDHIPW